MIEDYKKIYIIDYFKILATLIVICIHTKPFENIKEINLLVKDIEILAVPSFFLFSGFLIGVAIKRYDRNEYLIKYFKQNLFLFLKWYLLYFILDFIHELIQIITIKNIAFSNFKYLFLDYCLPNSIIYCGGRSSYHLWYILAVSVCALILYIGIKYNKLKQLLLIASALNLVGLLGQGYSFIYKININTREALFFGLIYVIIGYLLSSNIEVIYKYVAKVSVIWIVLLYLLLIVLQYYEIKYCYQRGYEGEYYFSSIFLAICLGIIIIKFKNLKGNYMLINISRNSLYIYLLHVGVFNIINWICNYFKYINCYFYKTIITVIVMIISYILASIINNIIVNKQYSF